MPPIKPFFTAAAGGIPNTETVPPSGRASPSTMSIVVVFPAPLGPSRATVWPAPMETSTDRTAWTLP